MLYEWRETQKHAVYKCESKKIADRDVMARCHGEMSWRDVIERCHGVSIDNLLQLSTSFVVLCTWSFSAPLVFVAHCSLPRCFLLQYCYQTTRTLNWLIPASYTYFRVSESLRFNKHSRNSIKTATVTLTWQKPRRSCCLEVAPNNMSKIYFGKPTRTTTTDSTIQSSPPSGTSPLIDWLVNIDRLNLYTAQYESFIDGNYIIVSGSLQFRVYSSKSPGYFMCLA